MTMERSELIKRVTRAVRKADHLHEEKTPDNDQISKWVHDYFIPQLLEQGLKPTNTEDMEAACKDADERFETSGGSSRHWVFECFLPALEERGADLLEALELKE